MDKQTHNPFQSLHAYWRMPYIKTKKQYGQEANENPYSNPFINLKDADEKEKGILIKGQYSCVLLNRFPYNAGHLLVLPYRVLSDLSELNENERVEFINLIIEGKALLSNALKPNGFNVGFNLGTASGAGIPEHLHCHIVPRWDGDHNFMPVIANTRVLPESMDALWDALKNHCQ